MQKSFSIFKINAEGFIIPHLIKAGCRRRLQRNKIYIAKPLRVAPGESPVRPAFIFNPS